MHNRNGHTSAYMGERCNRYGTRVALFVCRTCRAQYSVCPHPGDDLSGWTNSGCTSPTCESYDSRRDVDLLVGEGAVDIVSDEP